MSTGKIKVWNALFLLLFSYSGLAMMPEKCIQLPERKKACPNILYKKSPIKLLPFSVNKGEIVCICMADFSSLRIPAKSEVDKIDQQVTLQKIAEKLALPESDLLILIRQ